MTLKFEVFDNCDGVFEWLPDPSGFAPEVALDDALDARNRGQLSERHYVLALQQLIKQAPEYIDGLSHLGNVWFEQGKFKKALTLYQQAVALGERLMPQDYRGKVEWGHLDNRPFLRALHGASLCELRLTRQRAAVASMERLLQYNPNDHQGVRFLLGSAYLRLGDTEQARTLLGAEAPNYPPYEYELALLHLEAGEWIAAATALRRGFCANPYIAEMLCGHPDPRAIPMWHGTSLAQPQTARDYLENCAARWQRRPSQLAFVHWLYHHPRCMAERAAVFQILEALLWEQDYSRRVELGDQQRQLLAQIDHRLSGELVVKRTDRRGKSDFPWNCAL